jgi:hypothetical protein
MPDNGRVIAFPNHKVFPITFDRRLTDVLADIDDFVRMRTFADQVAQTENPLDVAAFNIVQRGF